MWGIRRGRVASPTLWRHSRQSPVPSNSQQEALTCRSHEFCGRPIGHLHAGLSLLETTRHAGSASG
ncbi:hypothetical protein E2C01_071391 [Portunus trituberculatus]|uniref:Uncharacterized protein n=1 Tax=Portunus trituberculatus TaxID=210409 RepID=A0A5B7I840_PORTR|nr:hypothetical protein [Portunus trituberculatus]